MRHSQSLFVLFCSSLLLLFSCEKELGMNDPTACSLNETEQAVQSALETAFAYPFELSTPTAEVADLQPMVDYLSTATFVGMGEATHGTKEFYQMKDQLFRQLVTQKDFKAIIFEIPWGNALVVNDFVTKGIGNADSSIDQTFYWTYNTGEVRTMTQWMHDYNEGLAPEEKIWFVGCDIQGPNFEEEQRILTDYLEKVMPDSIGFVLDAYKKLPSSDLFNYATNSNATIQEKNRKGAAAVYDFFVAQEGAMMAASSCQEYQIALMAAHVVQHRERVYRTENYGEMRDSLMALYAEWWQRILGESAQVAIWAHNAHVMNGASLTQNWMGTYLKARHDENYKNVGFSFGQGSFYAFVSGPNFEFVNPVRKQQIETPVCGTANQLLSSLETTQYYLIFEELTGEAQSYFNETQKFVQLGAGFNIQYVEEHYTRDYRLSKLFDVLIHFDETVESALR